MINNIILEELNKVLDNNDGIYDTKKILSILTEIADKRVIIAYKGGGYVGCWFEWNYCFMDHLEFSDIGSSGYKAITNLSQLIKRIDEKDIDIYDIDSQADINQLLRKENFGNLINIAKWLDENKNFTLRLECNKCSDEKPLIDYEITGHAGAGGIAIQVDSIVCGDCYHDNLCEKCGEYYDELEIVDSELSEYDEGLKYCEYCIEELKEVSNNE